MASRDFAIAQKISLRESFHEVLECFLNTLKVLQKEIYKVTEGSQVLLLWNSLSIEKVIWYFSQWIKSLLLGIPLQSLIFHQITIIKITHFKY